MIDKNKAYRFRGDNERWVWNDIHQFWHISYATNAALLNLTANHLHERGILLEYPELPGDEWEFCDGDGALQAINSKEKAGNALVWDDVEGEWTDLRWGGGGIYCRKKKPVITEFEVVIESLWATGDRIYLPSGFAGPGDKVKVTKL